ncbi:MAG TPA: hypothetical protein PK788_13770 [Gemmatimonadaceae bacterium]|nr:hypothetical protein [Gemmatimonadaceae bacterium]HRQ77973.1 hypothetical protein [Gemmatimonadaceae bacterium]
MTIRRPRTPVPTLRHAVFLEALAERPPYEADARALTATLLTLRLADEWLRSGAVALEPSGNSLRATLAAIDACVEDETLRTALRDAVEAMCAVKDPDAYVLAARLEPVATRWAARGEPQLAADVRHGAAAEAPMTVIPGLAAR